MSEKLKRRIILTTFAVGFVIMGFLVGQYYLSRTYEQQVEMGYRRALSEFASHLQELELELNRARLAVSEQQCQKIEASVSRLVYAAQSNMGELPVGELQLERIAHLLDSIGDEDVYEQIKLVNVGLQSLLLQKEKKYPWVSWRDYLRASPVLPTFLQGLVAINGSLEDFKKPDRSGEISGNAIDELKAQEIARVFSGTNLDFRIVSESTGTIPAYTLEAVENAASVLAEVSKYGGMVLWMLFTKQVQEGELSMEDLIKLGEEFLEERGFPLLHLTDIQSLQKRVIFTFVPKRGDVLYYGEPLKLQLSSSDGSVLGFWGTPFYLAQSRTQVELEIENVGTSWSFEEKIKQGAEILDQKLAVVQQEQTEILVQRLGIQYQGDYYLVYLNALTGDEERIEQVSSAQYF